MSASAAELQAAYREARGAGDKNRGRELWEAWFARSCIEGHPPDALRRDQGTIEERYWARTVPGPEGHVFWNDRHDWQGRPVFRGPGKPQVLAQRFAWRLRHGKDSAPARVDVWAACGERNCLNVDHLEAAWRPRGNALQLVPNAEMLERLKQCAERIGHGPSAAEYDEWRTFGMHSSHGVTNRFARPWTEVLAMAGLEAQRGTPRNYADAVLFTGLRELADELGHPPSSHEWMRSGRSPVRTIFYRRFGSWGAGLARAGLR